MTDKERISEVIKWSGLSSNAFAKRIGYASGGSIYNKKPGGRDINLKLITKIANVFTEINKNWLLTGQGTMINGEPISEPISQIINEKTDIMDAGLYYRMMDFIMKESSEKTELIKILSNKIPDVELKSIEKERESKKSNLSHLKVVNKGVSAEWLVTGKGEMFGIKKKERLNLFEVMIN